MPSPLKSATPTTDQFAGMLPSAARRGDLDPFMNHIAALPFVSRHSISAVPSPLKSRWPTIDQVPCAECRSTTRLSRGPSATDATLTAAIAPGDVALAVAVEVVGSHSGLGTFWNYQARPARHQERQRGLC